MTSRSRTIVCFLALTAFGCGGSGGGATGGSANGGLPGTGGVIQQTGGSGGIIGNGECTETTTDVAPDSQTALGFSANDLLATVGGARQSDLYWMPSNLYATNSLAGTATPLTLEVTLSTTLSPTYVDSQGGGCPSGGLPACIECRSRLLVPVDMAIATGDGALNEHVAFVLEAYDAATPTFVFDVDAASLVGTYLSAVTPQTGYTAVGIHFDGGYGVGFAGSWATVPDAWNGFVAARVRPSDGSTLSEVWQAHGYFPKATAGQ